ncbi:MAG: YqgE/AlgH family protein [Bacteroidales bacterium]|nr:YqgE/AlgH family protein [Bacteroidales bacterium]
MAYQKDLLKVKQTEFELAPGRMLISVPFYNDTFFNRSVVLLTDCDKEHTAGLIINHRLPYQVKQLVDEVHLEAPMFLGGPVLPSALFLLHNFESCKSAAQVVPGVYVGYDQVLLALIEHNAIPTMRYRFMMGYAGWSPGQLEEEISHNMWVIGNPTADLIFNTAAEDIWPTAVKVLGKEYEHWLQVPKYINLN